MSNGNSTLGPMKGPHTILVPILVAGVAKNLAAIIEAHFDTIYGSSNDNPCKAENIFYVKNITPATGTVTFAYAKTAAEAIDGNHYAMDSALYAAQRADCQNNAERCWLIPSGNINLQIVVYTDGSI